MITHSYLYTRSIFGIQQVLAKNCTWNKVEMGKSHILRVIFHNILSCGIRNWKHAMFFLVHNQGWISQQWSSTYHSRSVQLTPQNVAVALPRNPKSEARAQHWSLGRAWGRQVVYQMLHQSTWPKCDHSKGIYKVHQRMIRIKVIKHITINHPYDLVTDQVEFEQAWYSPNERNKQYIYSTMYSASTYSFDKRVSEKEWKQWLERVVRDWREW